MRLEFTSPTKRAGRERDDDLVLMDYIDQQKRLSAPRSGEAAPPAAGVEPRTIYDQRLRVQAAAEIAAPRLYSALRNLLNAVEERRDLAESIESVTLADAHNALVSARPDSAERLAAAPPPPSEDGWKQESDGFWVLHADGDVAGIVYRPVNSDDWTFATAADIGRRHGAMFAALDAAQAALIAAVRPKTERANGLDGETPDE